MEVALGGEQHAIPFPLYTLTHSRFLVNGLASHLPLNEEQKKEKTLTQCRIYSNRKIWTSSSVVKSFARTTHLVLFFLKISYFFLSKTYIIDHSVSVILPPHRHNGSKGYVQSDAERQTTVPRRFISFCVSKNLIPESATVPQWTRMRF